MVIRWPDQNKWGQMKLSNLVPNQNKSHLVIDWPGQTKADQMKCCHLVPNQTKWHLVIGWPGQNKSGQMKFFIWYQNKQNTFGNWLDQMNTSAVPAEIE